jgi:hypothetical protein
MPQFSTSSSRLKPEFLSHIPRLRAFAISFCGNIDQADDLVQDPDPGLDPSQLVHQGNEHERMALHNPTELVFLAISQARGSGH